MSTGVRIGRFVGAPIVGDASAFVLSVLFAIAVVVDLRTSGLDSSGTDWAIGILAGVAVLGGVLVHELSHAWVAERRGLHVRAIRVYLFGGYSVIDGSPSPSTEALVAIAGPVSSLLLGGVCWGFGSVVGNTSAFGRAILAVALANVAIGLFNLIPGFPLDGGRVLRGVLASGGRSRVRATRTVTLIGRAVGWIVIGSGIAVTVAKGPYGLLIIAAGWFLASAAVSSGRREQLSASLDGVRAADAMRATPEAVSGDLTVSSILDLYALGPRLRSLPVEMGGRVVGLLGQDEVDAVAPSRWPSVRARGLMTPIGPDDVVEADEPLESLLLRPAGRTRRAVVVEDGTVVGVIEGEDLARVLPQNERRA